jgi:hypothetical protein
MTNIFNFNHPPVASSNINQFMFTLISLWSNIATYYYSTFYLADIRNVCKKYINKPCKLLQISGNFLTTYDHLFMLDNIVCMYIYMTLLFILVILAHFHFVVVDTVPYSGALSNCRDCDMIEWTIFLFQVSWSRIFIVCISINLTQDIWRKV